MGKRVEVAGIHVANELHAFIENDVLPDLPLSSEDFWLGLATLLKDFRRATKHFCKLGMNFSERSMIGIKPRLVKRSTLMSTKRF